jgi:transcriptional regulator with XRE-family HTH domain
MNSMRKILTALVAKRRMQLGWSQTDLAHAMGSSRSRICKLEAGDETVAESLMLKALETMNCPLRIEVDSNRDPILDPSFSKEARRHAAARLLRIKRAQRIARKHEVDADDVEHALFNLTLPPWERLARSLRRGRLTRYKRGEQQRHPAQLG